MAAKWSNAKFRKTVHHNVEIKLPCKSRADAQAIPSRRCQSTDHECAQHTKCLNKKYAVPEFNSVLAKKSQIERFASEQLPQFKTTAELTPRSKAAIAPKINHKLNFGLNRTVFKNLTPININDSILLPQQTTSLRKKYIKSANKMPPPDLCDFLDPLPPLTHHIREPDIVQNFTREPFDFFNCYMRLLD